MSQAPRDLGFWISECQLRARQCCSLEGRELEREKKKDGTGSGVLSVCVGKHCESGNSSRAQAPGSHQFEGSKPWDWNRIMGKAGPACLCLQLGRGDWGTGQQSPWRERNDSYSFS